jgi:hypothetical protein
MVSPLETQDILVSINAVFEKLAGTNTSHHISTITDNCSWALNIRSMYYILREKDF